MVLHSWFVRHVSTVQGCAGCDWQQLLLVKTLLARRLQAGAISWHHAALLAGREAFKEDWKRMFPSSIRVCVIRRLGAVIHCTAHERCSWTNMAAAMGSKACVQTVS